MYTNNLKKVTHLGTITYYFLEKIKKHVIKRK